MVMANKDLQKILSKKKGKKYDVAVMYSGGKDSSYLLHLFKEVYKLRVLAVIVDNGFENEYMWKPMMKFTESMDIPLEIIHPGKDNFKKLMKMLVTEQEYFRREGINHVCFICNNLLWTSVTKYALENDIPYVASGLSLAQLSSGREYPLEPNEMANAIAGKSTKMVFKNAVTNMKKTTSYIEDVEFQKFIEAMNVASSKITTVYPYIYHNLGVNEIKEELVKLNWAPPRNISIEKYISSGCMIMSKIIGELEKLNIITLNEREQAKWMVADGLMDKENLEFANYDPHKDVVDLSSELMDELKIKDYLIELCKKEKRHYKI